MVTNIDIDQEKLKTIMEFKKFKSKKEAVNEALSEYVRMIARQELLKMRGKGWEGDLDEMRRD
jgi:Arc/MetJ family transcription regulator